MQTAPFAKTLLTLAIRRGLTLLGTAGAAVSDDWVSQTASLLLIGGNELVQWYWSYHAEKAKTGELGAGKS